MTGRAEPPPGQLAADVQHREQRQQQGDNQGGHADAEVRRPRLGHDVPQARGGAEESVGGVRRLRGQVARVKPQVGRRAQEGEEGQPQRPGGNLQYQLLNGCEGQAVP